MIAWAVGLSHGRGDGRCPSRSSDQAEGVTGRVGVDTFSVESLSPEGKYPRLGGGHVFDHDVQVDLLRDRWVRPRGRAVVSGKLEGQARRGVVGSHDNPVVALVGDRLPEQLGAEGCQGGRVGAVEHDMVQSSEHAGSMTDAVPSPGSRHLSATLDGLKTSHHGGVGPHPIDGAGVGAPPHASDPAFPHGAAATTISTNARSYCRRIPKRERASSVPGSLRQLLMAGPERPSACSRKGERHLGCQLSDRTEQVDLRNA
jgi:hypothetical protein